MEVLKSQALQAELTFATVLARDAGKVMLDQFGLHTSVTWKEDGSPVTGSDVDINQLIIDRVRATFPDDGVLGEEASYEADRDRLWVVDPEDGTQAESIGVPLATTCIALVVNREPVMGVIYDPFMDRMFQACAGEGAFMNGEKLAVSEKDALTSAYVYLSARMGGGFASSGQITDRLIAAGGKPFSFRSFAYGCMLVATKGMVGAIAGHLEPWDAAATSVILQEAGATLTDFHGSPVVYDRNSDGFLASNGKLHSQLLEAIKKP
jgi:fructose-1,6-bisphosphatase/inositol monophosphatase family enzyme